VPSTHTKIYFDGGCRPNPGPMETAIVVKGVSRVRTDLGTGGSSEAEWLALIHAAETAIELGLDDVVFIGDSQLVINQAKGLWKCRAPAFQIHLAQFRILAARLPRLRLRHVPRSKNLAGIALERRHNGLDPDRRTIVNSPPPA
jgi:ribonuclease HI